MLLDILSGSDVLGDIAIVANCRARIRLPIVPNVQDADTCVQLRARSKTQFRCQRVPVEY